MTYPNDGPRSVTVDAAADTGCSSGAVVPDSDQAVPDSDQTDSSNTEPVRSNSPSDDAARTAVVVGLGLIGSSLALALKRCGWVVSGVEQDAERLASAVERGVVDAEGFDPAAEVVFVATPTGAVTVSAREALTGCPVAVVSDVAGVKSGSIAEVDDPRFVGGHPMAGSEQTGPAGADADMFMGAIWVLTPHRATDTAAFARLRAVISSLGAEVMALSPRQHDEMVAVASHVPHLTAATLMNLAGRQAEEKAVLLRLAAGGFRDMTRVAAGHPGIWIDICTENARAIVETLDTLVADLTVMRDQIATGDQDSLLDTLSRAAKARRALPAQVDRVAHGAGSGLTELRVPVPDRPGVLAEITTLAGQAGVNILDLEIAHSTEGSKGVLVLVVGAEEGPRLAAELRERGYKSNSVGIE